jgi:hypothetical protein
MHLLWYNHTSRTMKRIELSRKITMNIKHVIVAQDGRFNLDVTFDVTRSTIQRVADVLSRRVQIELA